MDTPTPEFVRRIWSRRPWRKHIEALAAVERVRALLRDMNEEFNGTWKEPEANTYDAGADDQLLTDVRKIRAALGDRPADQTGDDRG